MWGLYARAAWAGVPFTLLLLVALVNAANLIDGVDGLCSGLGVLIFSVLSLLNLLAGNAHLALLGACAVGATLVFFMYNVFGRKLKIFMGDSGSLILGYTHLQCTLMIVLIQAVYIVGNFLLADRVNINVALLINIVAMVVLVLSLNARIRRRERRWL